VPSFSLNEGIKFAGHPAEWGEEQAKIFTAHRYHQPSDEYSPDMEFYWRCVIARFGFVLGTKAATAADACRLGSGDEFEAARKQSLNKLG